MVDMNEAKRHAAGLIKSGDAAGLKRYMGYLVESTRRLELQSEWAKQRMAKVQLIHDAEKAKESARVAKVDAEVKELKALLAEVKGMTLAPAKPTVPVPVPAPAKPAPAKPAKVKK